jgi:hypothetical protein
MKSTSVLHVIDCTSLGDQVHILLMLANRFRLISVATDFVNAIVSL